MPGKHDLIFCNAGLDNPTVEKLKQEPMKDYSPVFTHPVLTRGSRLTTVAEAMNYVAALGPDIWADDDYQETHHALVAALDTQARADVERANLRLSRFLRDHDRT